MQTSGDLHGDVNKKSATALFLLEQTEMYASVRTCLYVSRMLREIGIFAVLYDQPPAFFENTYSQIG